MKSFRERRPWLVGLLSMIVIAIGLYLAFSINRFEGLRGVYTLGAELEDAAGLQSGNEVRVAGVKVGRVTAIRLTSDAAVIDMEIEDDVRLPVETRLEVKLKTILGQKFIDLQLPRSFVSAAATGSNPQAATDRFLEAGDVIDKAQTKIPYEIYQAATEGTARLEQIDKGALRRLVGLLGKTIASSKDELRGALTSLDRAGGVLAGKNRDISRLLGNARKLSDTLAGSDQDLEDILARAAEVLGVLADRRATTSSLLAATDDLTRNLGLLVQAARGSIETGTADLNGVLTAVQGELDDLDLALAELGTAQELFGQNIKFGRFIEGHACAVTTADLCVPSGSPTSPGVPLKGTQPGAVLRRAE